MAWLPPPQVQPKATLAPQAAVTAATFTITANQGLPLAGQSHSNSPAVANVGPTATRCMKKIRHAAGQIEVPPQRPGHQQQVDGIAQAGCGGHAVEAPSAPQSTMIARGRDGGAQQDGRQRPLLAVDRHQVLGRQQGQVQGHRAGNEPQHGGQARAIGGQKGAQQRRHGHHRQGGRQHHGGRLQLAGLHGQPGHVAAAAGIAVPFAHPRADDDGQHVAQPVKLGRHQQGQRVAAQLEFAVAHVAQDHELVQRAEERGDDAGHEDRTADADQAADLRPVPGPLPGHRAAVVHEADRAD